MIAVILKRVSISSSFNYKLAFPRRALKRDGIFKFLSVLNDEESGLGYTLEDQKTPNNQPVLKKKAG